MELFVFLVAGCVCIGGALSVVFSANPVHAALSLVATLFGVAVLFVAQEANFLAAVQVIVYAGAIVVLFLFVLMLLGVDRAEDLTIEPIGGQRIAALVIALAIIVLPVLAMNNTDFESTGARPAANSVSLDGQVSTAAVNRLDATKPDVEQIGESLFTDYLFAFEITSVLLVIAVIGAVVLARKVKRADLVDDPLVTASEVGAAPADTVQRSSEAAAEADPAAAEVDA